MLLVAIIFGIALVGLALAGKAGGETAGAGLPSNAPPPAPALTAAQLAQAQAFAQSAVTQAGGTDFDPHDPTTWPDGDSIGEIVHAIALAEGYGASGWSDGEDSAGTAAHNPGDLSDNYDTVTYGVTYPSAGIHSGSNIIDYLTHQNGWNLCYNKIRRMIYGQSTIANAYTTWQQLANVWVGDESARSGWVDAVTSYLGVQPTDHIGEYAGVSS